MRQRGFLNRRPVLLSSVNRNVPLRGESKCPCQFSEKGFSIRTRLLCGLRRGGATDAEGAVRIFSRACDAIRRIRRAPPDCAHFAGL